MTYLPNSLLFFYAPTYACKSSPVTLDSSYYLQSLIISSKSSSVKRSVDKLTNSFRGSTLPQGPKNYGLFFPLLEVFYVQNLKILVLRRGINWFRSYTCVKVNVFSVYRVSCTPMLTLTLIITLTLTLTLAIVKNANYNRN